VYNAYIRGTVEATEFDADKLVAELKKREVELGLPYEVQLSKVYFYNDKIILRCLRPSEQLTPLTLN
jgi:hypothetical protein